MAVRRAAYAARRPGSPGLAILIGIPWVSVLFPLLVGCASAHRRLPPERERRDRNSLTRRELTQLDSMENAHAAVLRLRPWFLNPRPGAARARGQAPTIAVFINGQPAGGPEALLRLLVAQVESIHLIQPTDAYAVLGAGRGADAVINVILRRQSVPNQEWTWRSSGLDGRTTPRG